jgi:amidophosphoribosyltransferase
MGVKLAKQVKAANLDIDVVVPVPDTSKNAALELAQELGIKYREALVKNRYVGRTFIMPGQSIRKKSIKYKLNPIRLEIEGRNVLLVDDSIVRGNTIRQIVEMVRQAGAKKVFVASCSPALKFPCVYGVDMPSKKSFIAHQLSTEEIAKLIGADHLFYQDLKDLIDAARKGNTEIKEFCTACLSGVYPTAEVTQEYLEARENGRGSKADVSVESLGEGPSDLLDEEVGQETLL